MAGVCPVGNCVVSFSSINWEHKVIFPLDGHIRKSTQGASSLVLLKPVPVSGRVSYWSHLCHFHKGFESGRKGQGRTREIIQEKIPHSKKCKYSPVLHIDKVAQG